MRTTIVPAQVTTVEDRIIGNMGGMQSALLIVATMCATAVYIFLPPFFSYDSYKLLPMLSIAAACGLLAIRIRGRIIITWIVVIGRYMLRPKYYTYDKRSPHLRDIAVSTPTKKDVEVAKDSEPLRNIVSPVNLTIHEAIAVGEFVANPQTNLHIKSDRKGRISVHFNEVQ
jgi:hypothetical protein